LVNRDSLLAWSQLSNPIEAYFLAAYLNVDHNPPEFNDPVLNKKLARWLAWSKTSWPANSSS
jgi:hypothetical protein